MDNISIQDAGILAALGYGVVFLGLILLMIVVICIGKCFSGKKAAKPAAAAAPAAETAAPAEPEAAPLAPGSAGSLKLYDTPPKIAAMLMAIVADATGKPLNELRFISIKEVK